MTDKSFTPVHIHIPNQSGIWLPGFDDNTVVYKLQRLPSKDSQPVKKKNKPYTVKPKQINFGSEQGTFPV